MNSVSGAGASQSLQMQQMQGAQRGGPGGRPPGPPPEVMSEIESAASAAGLDSSQITDLKSEIESAIQSAKESGSGREGVKEAVNSVLADSGIDFDALNEKLASITPAPPPYTGQPQDAAGSISSLIGESGDEIISKMFQNLSNLPAGSLLNATA